jgi:hypothetical protein
MLLSWSGLSRLGCILFAIVCITVTVTIRAMHSSGPRLEHCANLFSNDVIVRSTSTNNRFYITGATAKHFGLFNNAIRHSASIPEVTIDAPLSHTALQRLSAYAHNNKTDDTPNDTEIIESLFLARALKANGELTQKIIGNHCIIEHPDATRPILVPDTITKKFDFFRTHTATSFTKQPLTFNDYTLKEIEHVLAYAADPGTFIQNRLNIRIVTSLQDLIDYLQPTDPTIMDHSAFITTLHTKAAAKLLIPIITNKKKSLCERCIAIKMYGKIFNSALPDCQKQLAQKADSNDPAYNICDALYELMYDAAVSPTWKVVTQIAPLYNDKSRWNDEEDKKLEPARQERCKTILDDIEKALTTWRTQDQAAKLFWAIKKESDQPEFTETTIMHKYTTIMYGESIGFNATSNGDTALQLFTHTPQQGITYRFNEFYGGNMAHPKVADFKETLATWLTNSDIRTYTIYCENARRIHLPFFAAIFGPLSCGDGLHYYFRGGKPLRLLSHSDLMALNTPRTNQYIELNIGNTTKMAPLSMCKRPLNINGVLALPSQSNTDNIYDTAPEYRQFNHCILPPSWRLHTLLELGALVGAAALSYRYIFKPIDTMWTTRQQISLKTQIANEILASVPANSDDAMQYIFQRAHHNVPFMKDTIPLLGTILKSPVNRTSSYSLETMDNIEKLVNTTRSIEKSIPTTEQSIVLLPSVVSISAALSPWILSREFRFLWSLIKDKDEYNDDLLTRIYHAHYLPPIRAFLGRLFGLVGGLFVNPAHFVEPLHCIKLK